MNINFFSRPGIAIRNRIINLAQRVAGLPADLRQRHFQQIRRRIQRHPLRQRQGPQKKGRLFNYKALQVLLTSDQFVKGKSRQFHHNITRAIYAAFNNPVLDFLDEKLLANNAENILKAVCDTTYEAMVKAGDTAEELVLAIRDELEEILGRKLTRVELIKQEPVEETDDANQEPNGMSMTRSNFL